MLPHRRVILLIESVSAYGRGCLHDDLYARVQPNIDDVGAARADFDGVDVRGSIDDSLAV